MSARLQREDATPLGNGHAGQNRSASRLRSHGTATLVVLLLGLALGWPARTAFADPVRGSELYQQHCASCHGPRGRPALPGTPDFTRPLALARSDLDLLDRVRDGRGAMPAYRGVLKDREILDILMHLRTLH